MEPWLHKVIIDSAIIGGIVGGIAAYIKVSQMNKKVRQHSCPACGQVLGERKPGKRTFQQILQGGWTCPICGCDVDRFGMKRSR